MSIIVQISLLLLMAMAFILLAVYGCVVGWQRFGGRPAQLVAILAACVGTTIIAQKVSTIFFDPFIYDAGSYSTNDVLHVAATNASAYAIYDLSTSPILVYRREAESTNAADWVECLPRRTFGDLPADWHVPDATNFNYLITVDYVPPSPVHTNGVFEMRGFTIGETPDSRSAAFSTSTPKTTPSQTTP